MNERTGRFDWWMIAAAMWFIAGLILDGWAHGHIDMSHETFFTPFHAVFYSGFAAVAATMLRRRSQASSSLRSGACSICARA